MARPSVAWVITCLGLVAAACSTSSGASSPPVPVSLPPPSPGGPTASEGARPTGTIPLPTVAASTTSTQAITTPPPPATSAPTTTTEETLPPIEPPATLPASGPAPTDAVSLPTNPSRPVVVPLEPRPGDPAPLPFDCEASFVGDSLTVAAVDELAEAMASVGCGITSIGAKGGANIRYGVGLAADLEAAGSLGPIVVAALGTNDCAAAPDEIDRSIEALLDVAGPQRPVVWPTTNVATVIPYCQPTGDEVVNDRIRAAAERHPNVHVIEWWALASINPAWHPDGVHQRADARRTWAGFLANGVVDAYFSRGA